MRKYGHQLKNNSSNSESSRGMIARRFAGLGMRLGACCNMRFAVVLVFETSDTSNDQDRRLCDGTGYRTCKETRRSGSLEKLQSWRLANLDRCQRVHRRNVTPYGGDEKFLAGPLQRTKAVWAKLQPYFKDEQKKGVLAVDAKTPSTLLAHKAGYIDRDNEVIVGLQTDQPFKRAIFPYGGLRMVEAGLKAAGFDADPQVHEAFTKYRKIAQ